MVPLLLNRRYQYLFRTVRSIVTTTTSESHQRLPEGPSLDDFISDDRHDRIVLTNSKGRVHFHILIVLVLRFGPSPRLPSYLKTSIPSGASFSKIKKDLNVLGLHTVCEEARCPNIHDCWSGKDTKTEDGHSRSTATATIMVCLYITVP
jgi:lipoic acid synthetase